MSETPEAAGLLSATDRREPDARIRELEAEVGRLRAREQLVTETLLQATEYAARVRREAREDGALVLRKARAAAERRADTAARDRLRSEQELDRLREVTERTRERLSALLTSTLRQLPMDAYGLGEPAAAETGGPAGPDDAS